MLRKVGRIGLVVAVLAIAAVAADAAGESEPSAAQRPLSIRWFGTRSYPGEGTEVPLKLEALVSSKVGFPVEFVLMGGVSDAEAHPTILKLLASQDLPDIFQAYNMLTPGLLEQTACKFSPQTYRQNMPGQYQWLKGLIDQLGKDEAATWAIYQDPADGMMWGAPRIWEYGWVPAGQMWRKDILDQLNYPIPATLAEAEVVYAAYKATYPTKYCLTGRGQAPWQCFDAVFNAYGLPGADAVVRNRRIVMHFATREFREAIQVLSRWYAKGYWDPGFLKHGIEFATFFADGNYLGPLVWTKDWHYMDKTPPTQFLENLRTVPGAVAVAAPHLRADRNVLPVQLVWDPFLAQLTVFAKHLAADTAKLRKIMKVADLFAVDRDVVLLSGFGIEGVHYTIPPGETAPVTTDLVRGKSASVITDTWGFGDFWAMPVSRVTYLPRATLDLYERFVTSPGAMYGRDNLRYHYAGDTTRGPVTDEAGQPVQVTMKSEWFAMVVDIMTGKRPIEYYDEWLQAYHDGGGRAWEAHATRLYLATTKNP